MHGSTDDLEAFSAAKSALKAAATNQADKVNHNGKTARTGECCGNISGFKEETMSFPKVRQLERIYMEKHEEQEVGGFGRFAARRSSEATGEDARFCARKSFTAGS